MQDGGRQSQEYFLLGLYLYRSELYQYAAVIRPDPFKSTEQSLVGLKK